MKYEINGKTIEIKIVRKNNKNIYIRCTKPEVLTVTCNKWVRDSEIIKLIEKNKTVISKMLKQKELENESEQYFYYLGRKYDIKYDKLTKNVTFEDNSVVAKNEKVLKKFYQKECLRIFESELNRILPSFSNIPTFELKIRAMKTRWGVNNRGSKTITLNSELLKKDLDLLDYVIIHELCHFYEPNHSIHFWNHVEKYFPKYKEARKRLRG